MIFKHFSPQKEKTLFPLEMMLILKRKYIQGKDLNQEIQPICQSRDLNKTCLFQDI